ncbi:MAG: HAMP domain-containing protein, partial [Alphaproteobacteria bacterium]|nr:HAMP domain-containing protein [Alphaproteobacteria bacterium]
VLRSVNPVYNKPICQTCHGPMTEHPINGILFVDYDGKGLKDEAIRGALALAGSGALIVLFTILAGWWMINRHVLVPVRRITHAAEAFSGGDLDARVKLPGHDELSQLGGAFDDMAAMLQQNWNALEENKAFLQDLIDGIPDGVRVIDRQFNIVIANTAYCRQAGLEKCAVEGTPCYRVHGLDEPCPPSLLACPVHLITTDPAPVKCVHRHQGLDGAEVFVEISAAPISSPTQGAPLVVEVIRDLSQQMIHSHEHKLSELGQLAAGVAHEIHNPLASARLSVQAMLRQIERGNLDQTDLNDYLRILDSEIDVCVDVTKRLLKLSAVPEDQAHLVGINGAIDDLTSLLAHEARQRGIEVVLDMDDAPLRLMGTESELRVLALNLMQNAFHAMPNGGTLTITGRARNGDVEIAFQDTGVGIPPENLPYIYNPFFRHRADGVRGTGLGLSICKSIIVRYDGKLEAKSEVGKGTCMTVRFPDPDHLEH